jgi:hypothetical protein
LQHLLPTASAASEYHHSPEETRYPYPGSALRTGGQQYPGPGGHEHVSRADCGSPFALVQPMKSSQCYDFEEVTGSAAGQKVSVSIHLQYFVENPNLFSSVIVGRNCLSLFKKLRFEALLS